MRIYFVIDILNGEVVRAVRGEREKYIPIHLFSEIVNGSDPFEVLDAVKPRYLYVADLDRIMGKGSNIKTIEKLNADHIIADCGFKDVDDLENLNFTPVLGTETFDITKLESVDDVFVSVDLKDRKLLDASNSFRDWIEALEFLNSFELLGVIILTLDRVGTGSLDIELLAKAVEISTNPIFAGGGVKDLEDLLKLKEIGCGGALISTAVHTKSVPIDIVRRGYI